MRGFLRVVVFVFVGPFVGLLAMALIIGTYTLVTTGSPRDFTFGPELLVPGILIVAYSIGLTPALLTGIVAIFVARRTPGWRYWLWMALLGGVISLAGSFVVIGGGPELIGVRDQAPLIVMMTLAGIVAAFVCAMLFDGLLALTGQR